jgi:hypothetical protein
MSSIALSQLFLVSGLKPWRNGNEHDIATAPGEHELVIGFELVMLDTDHRSIVGHADQEVATFGVEERRNRLEHRMSHALVVLAIFLEAVTHAWLHAECWPAWHRAIFERYVGLMPTIFTISRRPISLASRSRRIVAPRITARPTRHRKYRISKETMTKVPLMPDQNYQWLSDKKWRAHNDAIFRGK